MRFNSRRKFLKQLGGAASLFVLGRAAFPFSKPGWQDKDFEMLVVGDSLVTGLGLYEKDKFYTLTKNWLENEFFRGSRKVNLKNKSHSGARLFLAEDEIRALSDAGRDPEEFYDPGINFSFPDCDVQIDIAAKEYIAEGKSAEEAALIMVSGGMTNINVSEIIDPFLDNKILRELIDRYCNHMMFRFLEHANSTFPNALITVVGYFPIVSKESSTAKIYNAVLELYKFPRFTKPVLNNIVTKQFFKILHNKTNKRSRVWFEESSKALQTAVNRLNEKTGKQSAVFVRSPITEDRCFGTKNSLLFGMAKKGRAEDPFYDTRVEVCGTTIESLKDVNLKFNRRFCELSAIGHPNIEGSKAYADAISKKLKGILEI